MKIGMTISPNIALTDSLTHVFRSTIDVLKQEHELIYRPHNYAFLSKKQQTEALKEILLSCDVLLGGVDQSVVQVRQNIGKQIPFFCYMLGSLIRGNMVMMKNHHLYRSTDVLLVNCTGDLEIARKFYENAQVRLLPFAFDESVFYPIDEASRQSLRATLGFNPEDKILLYSGRITLEKNVHSVLKIFSAVQKIIPNTKLMIVGEGIDVPFFEFGVCSINIRGTLEKVVTKLGIDREKVRFIGHKDRSELCGLYNIADVLINMTLHHDENFGLGQVEAMACGTPAIGANWGGLKDTIMDGETGYKVSTAVTATGVKLNWWEAINKIVSLLQNNNERLKLRENCRDTAYNKYSLSQFRQNLRSILTDCHGKMDGVSEPLRASEFARRYWNSCVPVWGEKMAYRNGVSPYSLYKELITPYTGTSQDGAAVGRRLKDDQVVCLAAPLIQVDEGEFEIDDPIFPLRITIPAEHKKVIYAVIDAMKEEPAITVKRLTNNYLAGQANIPDALEWMIGAGLILMSGPPVNEAISAHNIGSQMSLSLFSMQALDASTDFVTFR